MGILPNDLHDSYDLSVSEATSLSKNVKREDKRKRCMRLFLKPFWLIINSAQNKEREPNTFNTNVLLSYLCYL